MSKKDKKELKQAFLLLVLTSLVSAGGILVMIAVLDSI